MSSNYEWQKHQVNERIQPRLREAEAHRQAKEANSSSRPALRWALSIWLGVAIIAAVWLLAGCTPAGGVSPGNVEAETSHSIAAVVQDSPAVGWTLAEHIRFQDKREAYLDWRPAIVQNDQLLPGDLPVEAGTAANPE